MTVSGLLLFAAAPPALADAPVGTNIRTNVADRHVDYANLDLASGAGQETLRARVYAAASEMCATTSDKSELFAQRACEAAARRDLDAQIAHAIKVASATGAKPTPAAAITIALPQ
jgi:UrcA family protein